MSAESPRVVAARRMARVGIGAAAGMVLGTIAQVWTGDPVWSAAGAAAGAVAAVIVNRRPRRA